MSERSGEGWSGCIWGLQPVQGEGVVDGRPWYFRAKWDRWGFWVAEFPDADPVDVGIDEDGWANEGSVQRAGYIEERAAWALIGQSIAEFRAGRLQRVEASG